MIAKSTGIEAPFELNCAPPLLVIRFKTPQKILGWSLTKPGFASTREIVWFEVRDGDLPLHVDPVAFLKQKLSASGFDDAAAFMTSREIRRHHVAQSRVGGVVATCVATVGLSNGERVGARRRPGPAAIGTINMLVHVSRPLSAGAFVEAISIATEARTAAILDRANYERARLSQEREPIASSSPLPKATLGNIAPAFIQTSAKRSAWRRIMRHMRAR